MSTEVVDAINWSRELVQREMRCPGDTANAMRRIERRYGIPYSVLWSLRYRPPKDLFVSTYIALKSAYLSECERQEKILRHEREITQAKSFASKGFVRAADALASKDD